MKPGTALGGRAQTARAELLVVPADLRYDGQIGVEDRPRCPAHHMDVRSPSSGRRFMSFRWWFTFRPSPIHVGVI